jgi:hypothetical protein
MKTQQHGLVGNLRCLKTGTHHTTAAIGTRASVSVSDGVSVSVSISFSGVSGSVSISISVGSRDQLGGQ